MIGNHKRLNQGLWFNLMRRNDFRSEFESNVEAARGDKARQTHSKLQTVGGKRWQAAVSQISHATRLESRSQ